MPIVTTITVQAAPGLCVPLCDNPKRHISDAAPVQVELNAYYRRRMADGDLVPVANLTDFPSIAEHIANSDSQSQE